MVKKPLDDCLLERMRVVGLSSWRALQAQAGISRRALDQVRRGKWGSLRLEQLQKLAAALQWDLGSLLRLNGNDKMESTDSSEVLFSLLQPLLTSYPTVRQIAQRKPDWPARATWGGHGNRVCSFWAGMRYLHGGTGYGAAGPQRAANAPAGC